MKSFGLARLCLLLLPAAAMGFGLPEGVRADIRGVLPPSGGSGPPTVLLPPQARPARAEVRRGGRVEIEIRGASSALHDLTFRIRRPPAHGRLSNLRKTGRDTATVVYTHGDDDTSTTDSFTFSVRSESRGEGAPATVRLTIPDDPPRLRAPALVEFPPVRPGRRSVMRFKILNAGGGTAEGRITVPEPWGLAAGDDGSFALRRGRSRSFEVTFAPQKPGRYSALIAPTPPGQPGIRLQAESPAPFAVDPMVVVLSADAAGGRSAVLRITNQVPEKLAVAVQTPENIEAPAAVALGPGSSESLNIHVRPEHLGPVLGAELVLEGASHTERVLVEAPAIPARVLVQPSGPLDFGTVESGRTVMRTVRLRNDGGTVARLTLAGPPELTSDTGGLAFVLAPGEEREIELGLLIRTPGAYEAALNLEGLEAPLTVPLIATAVDAGRSTPSLSGTSTATGLAATPGGGESTEPASPGTARIGMSFSVSQIASSPQSATVSWLTPPGPPATYRLERRTMRIEAWNDPPGPVQPDDEVREFPGVNRQIISWHPHHEVTWELPTVSAVGENVQLQQQLMTRQVQDPVPSGQATPAEPAKAVIGGLPPASVGTFRLVPLKATGEILPASNEFTAATAPPPEVSWTWLWAAGGLLAAALLWKLRRARQPRPD